MELFWIIALLINFLVFSCIFSFFFQMFGDKINEILAVDYISDRSNCGD